MIETNAERQAPTTIENAEPSHLARYQFAREYIDITDAVLDAPCGSWYGTMLLSSQGSKVTGIDIDKGAIGHANEFFINDKNHFVTENIEKMSNIFPKNHIFDKIISFEWIEHVENPENFLSEISRLLKPNGLLIISTPKKPHGSPYHKTEYSLNEFQSFLLTKFKIKKMFGQIFTDIFDLSEKSIDPDLYVKFNFIAHCVSFS